jgi:hypothetical protein
MVDKFDYSKSRNIAAKLIDKFGESGSFVAAGSGSGGYDDLGNVIPAQPDTVINGTITPLLSYKQSEIDGETILIGDGYVFFHSETAPPIDSKTTLNGLVYRAVWVESLDSVAGVNIFRKVQLRR